MSVHRVCQICYQKEDIRLNFGDNHEAETKFHRQSWCQCGYSSGEEMMKDQDLGFTDNRWVGIIKYFLNEYYLRIGQGVIANKDEHARFFLKLLNHSFKNYRVSIELKPKSDDENWEYFHDGVPKTQPRKNIFDNTLELRYLPKRIVLDKLNENLLHDYKNAQDEIEGLKKNHIKKNRIIAGLIVALIVVGIITIFSIS